MPFRFRKIINIGKGFRINLSKGGVSTSLGKAGATVNIGKRGMRPTIGAPGTGISFTPSMSQSASNQNTSPNLLSNTIVFIISGILICIILFCCIGIIFSGDGDTNSTPTPQLQEMPVEQIIASTAAAAQTQTLIVAPHTFTPFIYSTPATLIPVTLAPSFTPIPTDTPFLLIIPTFSSGSGGEVCSCAGDLYNCTEHFSTQSQAQACFNYCVSQGKGDMHKLDENNNGIVCESLP